MDALRKIDTQHPTIDGLIGSLIDAINDLNTAHETLAEHLDAANLRNDLLSAEIECLRAQQIRLAA